MSQEREEVSPSNWDAEKLSGEYKKLLTLSVSDPKRFGKAVETYGIMPVYEAIILASTRELTGDPLPYVMTIAHSKWKDTLKNEEDEKKYMMRVGIAKERSEQNGKELAAKISKARKRNGE